MMRTDSSFVSIPSSVGVLPHKHAPALGRPDSRIMCTRIAVDTLREFGVQAQPLAVAVQVHNAVRSGAPSYSASSRDCVDARRDPFGGGAALHTGHRAPAPDG